MDLEKYSLAMGSKASDHARMTSEDANKIKAMLVAFVKERALELRRNIDSAELRVSEYTAKVAKINVQADLLKAMPGMTRDNPAVKLVSAEYDIYRRSLIASVEAVTAANHQAAEFREQWTPMTNSAGVIVRYGIDDVIQALKHRKDITHYDVEYINADQPRYLVAYTRDIIISWQEYSSTRKYNLGPYKVMIPFWPGANPKDIHMIPKTGGTFNPAYGPRHPHHMATGGGKSYTCWAEWAGIIHDALDNGQAVTLTNVVIQFLNSYNPGSPLVLWPEIKHKVQMR